MILDFCINDINNAPPLTHLDVIFRVWGDSSYSVPSKKIEPSKYYLVLTTKGSGVVIADGKTFLATEKSALLLQPSEQFSYRCEENCWEFWWFEFFILPSRFPVGQVLPMRLTTFQHTLIEQALSYAKKGHWTIAESLFWSMFEILSVDEKFRKAPTQQLLLAALEQYIVENYQDIQVEDLSDEFLVSKRTIYNLFENHLQCSPKQYIDRIRLEHAKQLLLNSTLSILEISEQLSYKNQFHFSKRFTQYYGVSPMAFRNLSR